MEALKAPQIPGYTVHHVMLYTPHITSCIVISSHVMPCHMSHHITHKAAHHTTSSTMAVPLPVFVRSGRILLYLCPSTSSEYRYHILQRYRTVSHHGQRRQFKGQEAALTSCPPDRWGHQGQCRRITWGQAPPPPPQPWGVLQGPVPQGAPRSPHHTRESCVPLNPSSQNGRACLSCPHSLDRKETTVVCCALRQGTLPGVGPAHLPPARLTLDVYL